MGQDGACRPWNRLKTGAGRRACRSLAASVSLPQSSAAAPGPKRTSSSAQAASSASRSSGSGSGSARSASSAALSSFALASVTRAVNTGPIGRTAFGQTLGQRGKNVARLSDQLQRDRRGLDRGVFEKQRQEVRQFREGRREAAILIDLDEVDHGLTAIAAFAMDVLEQMQRQ